MTRGSLSNSAGRRVGVEPWPMCPLIVTGGMAITVSSLGPGGTLAGAGLGFGLSAPFIPVAIADGALAGFGTGLIHGGIACLFR
jgi:hypothetical protein